MTQISQEKNENDNLKGSEIEKMAKFLSMTSIEEMKREFKDDEKYMSAIRKVEELINDPEFVKEYMKAEMNQFLENSENLEEEI